jgi:hypothetical protein
VPEPNEAADHAELQRDREKGRADRAEQARDRAEREKTRLLDQLRRLGVDPDTWQ